MIELSLIIVAIAALVVIIAVVGAVEWKKKEKHKEPDYYIFFLMGLIWVIIGIFSLFMYDDFEFSPLFTLGIIFLAVGLANKSKWKKQKTPLAHSHKMLAVISVLIVVFVIALAFLLARGFI
ncbi:MAG: hypothetical protein ABIJ92_00935 [Candidatus Aenigmatarchaeota archaeon]